MNNWKQWNWPAIFVALVVMSYCVAFLWWAGV